MHDSRKALKRCFAQTCAVLRANFAAFAESVGLDGFLADTIGDQHDDSAIAASALDELCEGDLGLNDRIVLLAVVQFLDEQLGAPPGDADRSVRLKDLKNMIESQAGIHQLESWIAAWYG